MICTKCKQSRSFGSDTWCLACSSWEALGAELTARWHSLGLRELAAEQVVSAVRGVRALRQFGIAEHSAGISRASEASRSTAPASATRSSSLKPDTLPPPPAPVKKEISSEESSSEEEETERREAPSTPARTVPKLPKPPSPPAHRERSRRRHRREGERSTKTHRGGRKHSKQWRTLENPSLVVHRRLPGTFFDSNAGLDGREALDRTLWCLSVW